jgi:hypothetical protein
MGLSHNLNNKFQFWEVIVLLLPLTAENIKNKTQQYTIISRYILDTFTHTKYKQAHSHLLRRAILKITI